MKRVRALLISTAVGLATLAGLYAFLTAFTTTIEFADPGLEAAVRDALEFRGGHIPRNDLERLTELDAAERGIESLEGVESMPNLIRIDLRGNRVSDLEPLAELSRLQSVTLCDNNIIDLNEVNLPALAQLPELRELNLRNNRGPSHPETPDEHERISDLTALAAFTMLERLDLRDNHIEDASPLAELERLRYLDLRDNRLGENEVSKLSRLSQLRHLDLRNNNLRDLSGIAELSALRYLNLHSNADIDSIVALVGLDELEELILRNVPIRDEVQVLAEFRSLRRLNVRNTGIRDLTVLADLMAAGALQDDPENNIYAELDIRENPVSQPAGDGNADGNDNSAYRVLEEYWPRIARRHPQELPR